jgi:hypothetical protein
MPSFYAVDGDVLSSGEARGDQADDRESTEQKAHGSKGLQSKASSDHLHNRKIVADPAGTSMTGLYERGVRSPSHRSHAWANRAVRLISTRSPGARYHGGTATEFILPRTNRARRQAAPCAGEECGYSIRYTDAGGYRKALKGP